MSLCDASGEDASGPQIAGSVVAFVKGVDLHTAGGAGVDELTAAQIDAHVADAAEGIEKHQITGLPLLGRRRRWRCNTGRWPRGTGSSRTWRTQPW